MLIGNHNVEGSEGYHVLENQTVLNEVENPVGTVTIMQGVSGSGKSTTTRLIGLQKPWTESVIVSADFFWKSAESDYDFDFRFIRNAHEWCYSNFIMALRKGYESVIVDNTNTTPEEYQKYVDLAISMNYNVDLCPVHGKLSEEEILVCFERNTHGVPLAAIQAQHQRMFK
jgi:predicted kinase